MNSSSFSSSSSSHVFNGTEFNVNMVKEVQGSHLSNDEASLIRHVGQMVMLGLAILILLALLCICLRNCRRRKLQRSVPSILLDEFQAPFLGTETQHYDPPPSYEAPPLAYDHLPSAPALS